MLWVRKNEKPYTSLSKIADGKPFKIKENRLWSEIYIKKSDSQIYRLNIFHKAFNSNAELWLKQLSDPHEEYIKDGIECIKIDSYNFNDPESITISLSKW